MDKYMRSALNSYLNELRTRCLHEQQRLDKLPGYSKKRLKIAGTWKGTNYYSVYMPESDTYKYTGSDKHSEVRRIKEAHYLSSSTKNLAREITAVEEFLNSTVSVTYDDINAALPKLYQNAAVGLSSSDSEIARTWKENMEKRKASYPPFRPEDLIHPTHDRTMVRSKSEAGIYNYLLEMGITFVYELPLQITINGKRALLLPDFTILSERDYKTIIFIEHQGMMSTPSYRDKFNESVYKYWLNNYIPERDVFFTFDSPNGGFDDRPIKDIIFRRVRYESAQL